MVILTSCQRVSVDQHKSETLLGMQSQRNPHTFARNPTSFSLQTFEKDSFMDLTEEGRTISVKFAQRFLCSKGLLSKGKTLQESCSKAMWKGHSSGSSSLQPFSLSYLMGQRLRSYTRRNIWEGHKPVSAQRHRPTKRQRLNQDMVGQSVFPILHHHITLVWLYCNSDDHD